MDPDQERQLAQGLQAGKVEAWQTLYEAYARSVWQTVARLLGPDSADVADVVQETFLAAARSARGYDPARGSLWLWLVGIARNHVALHYRKQGHRRRLQQAVEWLAGCNGQLKRWLAGNDDAPWASLASAELATLVRAALAELPAQDQVLLTGKYVDGTSVEDLAAAAGTSPTAIRSRLARARQAFREILIRPPFAAVSADLEATR
jgi:RNA polymerase sigma-70 factor (ECF subfamily)